MNIPIETPDIYTDVPTAEPGEYQMKLVGWKENVQTKNGVRDVLDFVGEDANGSDVGAACWIKGPEGDKKGTLWLYRRLAEALGADALSMYETKREDGFSSFRPNEFYGRTVTVEVNEYGVRDISPWKGHIEPPLPAKPDDDIPF